MKILIISRPHRNMFQMLPRWKRQFHKTNPVLLKIYLHIFLKVIPGFWIEELIPFTCNYEPFAAYTCREKLVEMGSTKRYATVLNKPCESWACQYVGGVENCEILVNILNEFDFCIFDIFYHEKWHCSNLISFFLL